MACSRIYRAWTWHAYKPQKEKSGFRGVCGLVFSFLKIPDNSLPVKSVFFHFLNDDSRFLLKRAREQGLMCKIRWWFLFNNDILKLWACVCFAVAVLASVWKAGPQRKPQERTKKRGYVHLYQLSIRRNIHIFVAMFADIMFKKRLLSFLCFLKGAI